jgi:hypothetical protein
MGKKPVLGLVGLCVGLTLSGCKDCGWPGWWGSDSTRKDNSQSAVRSDKQSTGGTQVSTYNGRQPLPADGSVAARGGDPSRLQRPFEQNPSSYAPQAPPGTATESAEKVSASIPDTVPTRQQPVAPQTEVTEQVMPASRTVPDRQPAEQPEIIPPPPPPVTSTSTEGAMGATVATPVESRKTDLGVGVKEAAPPVVAPNLSTEAKPIVVPKKEEQIYSNESALSVPAPSGPAPSIPAPMPTGPAGKTEPMPPPAAAPVPAMTQEPATPAVIPDKTGAPPPPPMPPPIPEPNGPEVAAPPAPPVPPAPGQ